MGRSTAITIKLLNIFCILALFLVACKIVGEIDVIVEQDNVTFSFQRAIEEENGTRASLVVLYVSKRERPEDPGSILWWIEANTEPESFIHIENNTPAVSCGETPRGMKVRTSAKPLTPGNYAVGGTFFIYEDEEIIRTYDFSNLFVID